jgi:hypothetical protein
MASKIVTLLQDCYVETRHHNQKLHYSIARKGDQVTLLRGNGYRTQLMSMAEYEDRQKASNLLGEFSPEAERAAYQRVITAEATEMETGKDWNHTYGALYEGQT